MSIAEDYLPYQKFGRNYLLPAFMLILFLAMLGQLALELFSVKQLNKVTGKITALNKQKAADENNSGASQKFSLIITLNGANAYTIENEEYAARLNSALKIGDDVTIYYPTKLVNVLSATFAESVSQVEANGQVLYSFKSQQQDNWYLTGFCAIGILLFYGFYRYLKGRYV